MCIMYINLRMSLCFHMQRFFHTRRSSRSRRAIRQLTSVRRSRSAVQFSATFSHISSGSNITTSMALMLTSTGPGTSLSYQRSVSSEQWTSLSPLHIIIIIIRRRRRRRRRRRKVITLTLTVIRLLKIVCCLTGLEAYLCLVIFFSFCTLSTIFIITNNNN